MLCGQRNRPHHKPATALKKNAQSKRPKLTPEQKEVIYALSLPEQFRIVHIDSESGYAVYQHLLVDDQAPDYGQILAVAKAYARETDCWINPEMDQNVTKEAREKIYPGIKDRANPDLTTDKYGYIDVKSPHNKSNLVRNANTACAQWAIAVITDLGLRKEEISLEEINKFTERVFSPQNKNHLEEHNYTKSEVHWFIKGTLIKCNRSKRTDSFPT